MISEIKRGKARWGWRLYEARELNDLASILPSKPLSLEKVNEDEVYNSVRQRDFIAFWEASQGK